MTDTPQTNPASITTEATATTGVAKSTKKHHLLTNDAYDALKWIALVGLPLAAAIYYALAGPLNLPVPEAVVGIAAAVDTALGGVLKLSDVSFNASESKYDGQIEIVEDEAKKIYNLVLKDDPQLIDQAKQILLKVQPAAK